MKIFKTLVNTTWNNEEISYGKLIFTYESIDVSIDKNYILLILYCNQL